jgi:hypothetical protein
MFRLQHCRSPRLTYNIGMDVNHDSEPPLVSGLVVPVAVLDMLPFLDPMPPPIEASSTLRSKKPAHRSARDSLPEVGTGSEKKSVFRDGVLGVLWKGEVGRRSVLLEVPGRARPACSRCSSVQFKSPAIICRIWNFLGSDRSRARNCSTWFVTICLYLWSARRQNHKKDKGC